MKSLLVLFVLVTFPNFLFAQGTLKGRVINAEDQKPLPFANVFLANTTKGTTTSDAGAFTLTQIPAGTQELVVSYVGFQTQTLRIEANNSEQSLEIKLKPNPNQLAEIKIKSKLDKNWNQRYEQFTSLFLGTTENARRTKILNPEAVWINEDSTKTWITVGSREPLLIECPALGYRIKYQLEGFAYHQKQGYLTYIGYPVYEEMTPKRSSDSTTWQKNRAMAYYGSLTHFLRSIHEGKMEEAGFKIQQMVELKSSPLNALLWQSEKLSNPVLTGFERYKVIPEFQPASAIVVARLSTKEQTILSFQGGLQVSYVEKKNRSATGEVNSRRDQISVVELMSQMVKIKPNGQFFPVMDLLVSGAFSHQKVADSLPFDYVPTELP
ncbi:carboxypeptidase-like regulatory domain-containing protein [Siphonobacter sp. SORGH_AS_0500]|uniref:carboxypeptidase-like regulatory domain-containing protein n=1 Tax=Siphonobacter sp. SORGH_AS_0500 TaxID=1864824 RepID=UPI002858C6AF|nr:carboxypeptidase-like regulatory domain-containing protein [Siphonobacter sp. SORGH_AS_0500]MDR6194386.1 hypothetical protein [Siphonobacter sp. SORGH_AS_0500]